MPVARQKLILAAGIAILGAGFAVPILALPDSGPGLWSGLVLEVQAAQRDLHRQLAAAMQAIQVQGSAAAGALVILSFLYGVFHAVGPGHGKIVISTYLLTQESQLRRGVALSLIASLAQGVTAVVIVEAIVGLLGLTFRLAESAAAGLEVVSYGLVAAVGAMLVVTRARRLHARVRQVPVKSSDQAGHAHEQDAACSHCGHAHGPAPSDIDSPISLRTLMGVILSVGIRPCSGAVIVLVAAHAMELRWAGIGAVLAMSIGTGLTVSLLAILSVYGRKASLRLAEILPSRASRVAAHLPMSDFTGLVLARAMSTQVLGLRYSRPRVQSGEKHDDPQGVVHRGGQGQIGLAGNPR